VKGCVPGAVFWVLSFAGAACAQSFSQRGFLQADFIAYPQTAPNDSGQAIGEALFRYEAFYKLSSDWQFAGGIDARADTHQQVDRAWELSWADRQRRRPSFEVRQLNATYNRKKLTVVLGRQFIRWGKADILNPTDRFAPRDFLTVVDNDFLAITAARARSRKARRSSFGRSATGAPNVIVHRIGTGTTSPLGITRCTLSIQAGISCTSGKAWASA